MQTEITASGPLLDERGRLRVAGYSKKPLLEYDRKAVTAGSLRLKEWDYYLVSNDRFAIALTVSDNGYIGLVSASLLDFEHIWQHTVSISTLLPRGSFGMPASSYTGNVAFENGKCSFSFEITEQGRRLRCEIANFKDSKPFTADILLTGEPEDSMTIAIPFARKKNAFYYNRKINCMRAEGRAEFNGKVYEFSPDDSFGTLDWGRGVWTYSNTWYWSSASGLINGVPFGFNLGYGFGDTSAATENVLFYNGHAHKLGGIVFNIPKDSSNRNDLLKSWAIGSDDGRLQLTFEPIFDRAALLSALVVCSNQHQVFGRFYGTARLDDGKEIKIRNFPGFAEKVKNRW
ncbi:MAG: DUF2804 domain-containing protein [Acetanaerobacterium sp.]